MSAGDRNEAREKKTPKKKTWSTQRRAKPRPPSSASRSVRSGARASEGPIRWRSLGTRTPAKDTGAFDERQLGEVGQQERSEKGVEGERGGEREGGREGGRKRELRARVRVCERLQRQRDCQRTVLRRFLCGVKKKALQSTLGT